MKTPTIEDIKGFYKYKGWPDPTNEEIDSFKNTVLNQETEQTMSEIKTAEKTRLSDRQKLRETELKELGFLSVGDGYHYPSLEKVYYHEIYSMSDTDWATTVIGFNRIIEKQKADAEFKKIQDAAEAKLKKEKEIADKKEAESKAALEKQIAENAKLIERQNQLKQEGIKKEIQLKNQAEAVALESIANPKERLHKWVDGALLPNMTVNGLNQEEIQCTTNIVEKLVGFRKWAHGEIDKLK